MTHYYLHSLSPFVFEVTQGVGVRWYGLCYVLAFLCGYRLYLYLSERRLNPIPPREVSDFITWAAVFGVMVGGRLGYMLLYDFERWIHDPLVLLRVWEGGMASHGGILGLVAYTFYYARKHRISWTGIGDSLVCVAPVGIMLVRFANFINGELYGRVTNVRWAVQFPTELLERPDLLSKTPLEGVPLDTLIHNPNLDPNTAMVLRSVLPPRHPSQIYEALLEGALLFVILWIVRTRFRVPRGVLTALFFLLYSVFRIAGEQFRQPEDFNFGLPRGVFLSFFLILIGVTFLAVALRRPEYEEGLR